MLLNKYFKLFIIVGFLYVLSFASDSYALLLNKLSFEVQTKFLTNIDIKNYNNLESESLNLNLKVNYRFNRLLKFSFNLGTISYRLKGDIDANNSVNFKFSNGLALGFNLSNEFYIKKIKLKIELAYMLSNLPDENVYNSKGDNLGKLDYDFKTFDLNLELGYRYKSITPYIGININDIKLNSNIENNIIERIRNKDNIGIYSGIEFPLFYIASGNIWIDLINKTGINFSLTFNFL